MGCALTVPEVSRESIREANPDRLAAAIASGARLRAVASLVRDDHVSMPYP